MKRASTNATSTVVAINGQSLLAFSCGYLAWIAWPTTSEWWHLGVISVLLWFACAGALIKTLKLVFQLWSRSRVILDFESQGPAPKSSALASTEKLRQMGMLDE